MTKNVSRKVLYTERELELVELLKIMDTPDAAKKMGVAPSTARSMLTRIRDKIELGRDSSNLSANWLDGAKSPRLAKLLRRQD